MSRTIHRLAVVLAAGLAALLTTAGVASAHVTVSSQDAAAGGYGKLTFRVPNESDTASTVAVRISVPEEAAMASLRAMPVPGWTVSTTRAQLAEPLESHGQEITEYVSVVEFRAEEGQGIGPGEFLEFALSGGPFPDADEVSYPAVQTYSDGTEAAWIEPTVGGEEPEYPAPVLTLSGAAAADGGDTATTDVAEASASGDGGSGTATTALVLGVVGAVTGVAGLALAWTTRRRTPPA
ncbi:YcnI family protein [Geodermatophilus sp. FMUSA9-8]|uniref:YcnI family protein n=1 Tax=Geodermatophilus sp. FMUSA9-8 TaxID=3120155 RepID=UPI003008E9A4